MIRAALLGVAIGVTATAATFIPAVRTLDATQRAWVTTIPRKAKR